MKIPEYLVNNIFLIDDDEDDCTIFNLAIKEISPSINFFCANNCNHIFDLLQKHKPDLIFLDLNLPVKSGINYLQEIKENILLKHIPIIIYSSSVYQKDISSAYLMGCVLYFQKPAIFKDLVNSLKQILKMSWNYPKDILAKQFHDGKYIAFEPEIEL